MNSQACVGIVVIFLILIAVSGNGKKKRRRRSGRSRRKRKPAKKGNGTIVIYKLMDGRKAFYVGQTVQPLNTRLAQHMDDLSGNDKSVYISRMRRTPKIVEICKTRSQAKANELENQYMNKWGLTNMKRA